MGSCGDLGPKGQKVQRHILSSVYVFYSLDKVYISFVIDELSIVVLLFSG